jgi:hypothetical protein
MQLPVDTRGDDGYSAAPISKRGSANGAGALTLTVGPVPEGWRWLINYVTVTTGGNTAPTVDLFIDSTDLPNLFDGTDDGRSAIAPYVPPRQLEQGQTLLAVWAGADAGAQCSMRVEYDVERAT